MKTWQRSLCLVVLFACGATGPGRAAGFNLDVRVEDVTLGLPITGPKLSADDLKGRVVVLEFWGIN